MLLIQSVTPLSEQLEQFKEYIGKLKGNFGEAKTNFILSKSLVLVVSSSNDIANTYFATGVRKLNYDVPNYTDMLVQQASSFVKVISLCTILLSHHKLESHILYMYGVK